MASLSSPNDILSFIFIFIEREMDKADVPVTACLAYITALPVPLQQAENGGKHGNGAW